MSSWWFRRKAPGDETTPDSGYDAFFVADGTAGTINGALYRKDSSGGLHLIDPSLVDYELWPILAPGAATTPATGFARLFVGDGTGGTTAGSLYTKNSTGAVTAIGPPASSGSRLMQLYSSGGVTPITGRGATTSGTAETFFFAAKIPAGSVAVGSTFRVTIASSVPATSGAVTYALSLRVGPAGTLSDTSVVHCAEDQNNAAGYWLNALVQVVATGSTATVAGHGAMLTGGNWPTPDLPPEVVANVPIASDWYIVGTAQSSNGSAHLVTQIVTVEAL